MNTALMRFNDFTWSINPELVQINSERLTNVQVLPCAGEVSRDIGMGVLVVTGEGELRGEDCCESYARLYSLHAKGKEGLLSLPGLTPIVARFTRLSAKASTEPDCIRYTFRFEQAREQAKSPAFMNVHIVKTGETLFDIAYEHNKTVDELVLLNPWVKRPDELDDGQEVKLC